MRLIKWLGQDIKELDKENLIKVIEYLSKQNQELEDQRAKLMKAVDPVKYLMQV